jgi:hypothetical protein
MGRERSAQDPPRLDPRPRSRRTHCLGAHYPAAAAGLPTLADRDFTRKGEGLLVLVPVGHGRMLRARSDGRQFPLTDRTVGPH